MKYVKIVECDTIQDLLPSYVDKVSSESSNKLIEQHLQKCQKCTKVLEDMDKEIDVDVINDAKKRIDYLKKYRKTKIEAIILAILLTILIILGSIIFLYRAEFFIDVNEFYVGYSEQNDIGEDKELTFYLINNKWDLKSYQYETVNQEGNKTIYLKVVGKYAFDGKVGGRYYRTLDISEDIEKVYLEDKKGKTREIWNKTDGFLS